MGNLMRSSLAGLDAPADFIKRLGHPTTFKESGVGKGQPKENVDSWHLLG